MARAPGGPDLQPGHAASAPVLGGSDSRVRQRDHGGDEGRLQGLHEGLRRGARYGGVQRTLRADTRSERVGSGSADDASATGTDDPEVLSKAGLPRHQHGSSDDGVRGGHHEANLGHRCGGSCQLRAHPGSCDQGEPRAGVGVRGRPPTRKSAESSDTGGDPRGPPAWPTGEGRETAPTVGRCEEPGAAPETLPEAFPPHEQPLD
mmetsp:Transcript_9182/g.34547  ORF Transcript_9182/g.34547 Transcript_9182/m.34547 type:complete len:205 (-) Transcript_9182:346-960(-)